MVVGHVGLGQQHVHVAGHAARHRVDRVVHAHAALLELVGQLAHRVLRLGHRHAVPGRHHDLRGVGELDRHVGRVGGAHRLLPRRRRPCRRPRSRRRSRPRRCSRSSGSSPRPSASVRIEPEAPTSMPPTISATLSSAMPAAAADSPVKAFSSEITTGMSAPPIGSTNMLPSTAAEHQDHQEQPLRLGAGGDRDSAADGHRQQRDVDDLLAGQLNRAAREDLLELAEGDVRAPEGDRADDRREQDRDQRSSSGLPPRRERLAVLDERDQRHRAAADAVEQRHHLRHRGHLHAARRGHADRRADARCRPRSGR